MLMYKEGIDDYTKVMCDSWHLVRNEKRAKLLRNRGEWIKWSAYYGCYIWDFKNRITKP